MRRELFVNLYILDYISLGAVYFLAGILFTGHIYIYVCQLLEDGKQLLREKIFLQMVYVYHVILTADMEMFCLLIL